MRIEIIRNKEGRMKKWKLIAENLDESNQLGEIRDAIFFGIDDTHPVYDGREDFEGQPYQVECLKWKIPAYCNEE